VAEAGPAPDWIWSSSMSFVFGAAGTFSSIVKPAPAVNPEMLELDTTPRTRSPPAEVAVDPLFTAVPVPSAMAGAPSADPDAATPEYSNAAKRSVPPEIESDTVTVFAPPPMLSA